MEKQYVLPARVYQNIVTHLQAYAPTDSWAASCLKQLQEEAKIETHGKSEASITYQDRPQSILIR